MVTVEKEINNNIVLDHQFNLTQNQIKHWHKKHIALCQPTLGCWKWASLIKTFGWHVLAASGACSNRWKMCHSLLLNCWPRGIVQNKYWVDLMEYKDWMGFHQAHHSSSHLIDFQGRTWFVVVCVFFFISSPILFGNNGTELTKLEETYRITKQICRNPTPPKTISTWTGWPDQDDIYRKWKSCNLLLGHSKSFLFLVTGTFDLCSCTRKGRLGSILNPSEFSGPAGRSGKKLWESKTWSVSSLCWEVSREEKHLFLQDPFALWAAVSFRKYPAIMLWGPPCECLPGHGPFHGLQGNLLRCLEHLLPPSLTLTSVIVGLFLALFFFFLASHFHAAYPVP